MIDYAEMMVRELAEKGFVVGASVRLSYRKNGELSVYSGKVLRIKLRGEVKAKQTIEQRQSTYLLTLDTEHGIKSFWEFQIADLVIL